MLTIRLIHIRKILGAIKPQKCGNRRIGKPTEEYRGPAKCGGCVTDRGNGMAHIMLTIAEGTFAILPRLSPVNRGQAYKHCSRGQCSGQSSGRFLTQHATPFETMITTDIMI